MAAISPKSRFISDWTELHYTSAYSHDTIDRSVWNLFLSVGQAVVQQIASRFWAYKFGAGEGAEYKWDGRFKQNLGTFLIEHVAIAPCLYIWHNRFAGMQLISVHRPSFGPVSSGNWQDVNEMAANSRKPRYTSDWTRIHYTLPIPITR